MVLLLVLFFVSVNLVFEYYLLFAGTKKREAVVKVEEIEVADKPVEEEFIAPIVATDGWKKYQNDWYGFEVKYPSDWSGPFYKKYTNNSKWEYKYSFYSSAEKKTGYELVVYNKRKAGSFIQADEYPELKTAEKCLGLTNEGMADDENNPRQFHVAKDDPCLENAFYFLAERSDEQGEYLFVLKPLLGAAAADQELRDQVKDAMPEFFGFAESYREIEIDRPTPLEIARANAPLPAKYKWENGRMVCSKENDKPRKSKQGKGRHLDMECCLDPDEDPNPHCYYPPEKYGDLLN